MPRNLLRGAASLVLFLLVVPASAVTAEELRSDAVAGTSYVFHAYTNAPQTQGIGVIRADESARTLLRGLGMPFADDRRDEE